MRPQHITAENDAIEALDGALSGASMRPQHITAENGDSAIELLDAPPLQ